MRNNSINALLERLASLGDALLAQRTISTLRFVAPPA